MTPPSGPRADFGWRLGGFVVDGLVLWALGALIGILVDVFVLGWLISVALGFAYHVLFIGSPSGQTPGMRLFKVRAISAVTDGRIDYGSALVRYVVSFFSGLAFFIGYLWMLWDSERQTWHDKVARTYVVPVSAYPVERWPG